MTLAYTVSNDGTIHGAVVKYPDNQCILSLSFPDRSVSLTLGLCGDNLRIRVSKEGNTVYVCHSHIATETFVLSCSRIELSHTPLLLFVFSRSHEEGRQYDWDLSGSLLGVFYDATVMYHDLGENSTLYYAEVKGFPHFVSIRPHKGSSIKVRAHT